MTDSNLLLYLPFDEPYGSSVAYDYSANRSDAALSGGADFSRNAKKGHSLALGAGEAVTSAVIPFSSDFTLALMICPGEDRIGWLLNLPGIDNYREQWFDVEAGRWVSLIIQKEETVFRVYLDYVEVFNEILPETPLGFSINEPCLINGTETLIDECVMYGEAVELSDVMAEQKGSQDVEYYIDGQNFKDYGVYVSKSNGIVGQLERKEGATAEYDTYHGIARDNNYVRYKERTITLECFIEASSRDKFVEWMDRFMELFRGAGTHRLKIEYNGSTKPLVYEVSQTNGSDPDKTWIRYNEGLMVGTFTLTLVEDDPVKMVLRHVGLANSESQITITTDQRVSIAWGDGTFTHRVRGEAVTVSHTYANKGSYDIIIAGVIENIQSIATNDIILWPKLM